MKNAKLENLIEALSVEPPSHNYDSVFSSMEIIDSKAHEVAKGCGVSLEAVYKAIDFYPAGFVSACSDDTDSLDFAYSDVMRDLQLLEKQLVPKEHRKYGGKMAPLAAAMMVLMAPAPRSESPFYIIKKPTPTGGEPVKRDEIVLKKDMGYVERLVGWAGRHPYLSAAGLIVTFLGGAAAYGQLYKSKDSDGTAATAVIAADSPQSLAPTPAPTVANGSAVKETAAPYQYNARAGNSDPTIKFIDGSGDNEWEDVINWHKEQFRKASPYDVGEFEKYLVFRSGKNPTQGIMQYTKDKREIFYIDDFYWTSIKSLESTKNKNITAWNLFRTSAHEVGHKKNSKSCAPDYDSKCIEMPAITYDTDAMIRAGRILPEKRDEMINDEWDAWKKQHNYTAK